MRWAAGTLLVILTLTLGVYIALHLMYPAFTHRYRLTIVVNVDGQIRSGSSVYEVTVRRRPQVTPETGASIQLRGEAVFVDLGATGNLVGLIAEWGRDGYVTSPSFLAVQAFGLMGNRDAFAEISNIRGRRDLPEHLVPILATFQNPSDSTSGRIVHPKKLHEAFGSGVSLERVWIEITTDSPSFETIFNHLPFLKTLNSYTGATFDSTWQNPAHNLTRRDFVRSEKWQ